MIIVKSIDAVFGDIVIGDSQSYQLYSVVVFGI